MMNRGQIRPPVSRGICRMLHGLLPCALLILAGCAPETFSPVTSGDGSPWACIVVGEQTEPERLATLDLQRYLGQVGGTVPVRLSREAWIRRPIPAVILGTPSGNPLLGVTPLDISSLESQGFLLAERRVRGMPVIFAAGATSEGAVNAVYGLLRDLGFGFYLGSEALPDALPPHLSAETLARNPAFETRGVLPWYNFYNSPTTWDPVDHRAFADQLIRMGANFIGFHTYDYEPFAAYEENGEMAWGERLLDTETTTWGTIPRLCADFAAGTDRLYPHRAFGAATTREFPGERSRAIQAEQAVMADALAHAKRRGLRTCIGFEISGDPTNRKDRDVFLKRLRHTIDRYPGVDYVWIWQPEMIGAAGYRRPSAPANSSDADSATTDPLLHYAWWRTETFQRVVETVRGDPPFYQDTDEGRLARALEGARLEQYARLGERVLRRSGGATKLIVSGWGGDQRLLSADYYDGLDKLLPADVAFASLDHIIPRIRIDAIYHELPRERQRWPIVWLEFDGDQWHPQPFVHTYESLLADALRSGSQGVLGIHWRTRDIEENFAYLMEFAWKPGLTAEAFFRDYARRLYPPAIAGEMADIHSELDRLGYRWVGGGGQGECAPFSWGPGEPDKARALAALRDRVATLLPEARRSAPRIQWLLDRIDWILAYDAAEHAVVEASAVVQKAAADPETHRETAANAIANLKAHSLADALRAYARRVSTRGEYGVLATINCKAVPAWETLLGQIRGMDKEDALPADTEWNPAPRIVVPRFLGSVEAGRDLDLEALVLGGGAAWMHTRRIGETTWETRPLAPVRGWVSSLRVPADRIAAPGFELALSFSEDPSDSKAFGPVGVTVFPAGSKDAATASSASSPSPSASAAAAPVAPRTLSLRAVADARFPVVLEWGDIAGADFYRVYREGRVVAETGVNAFPDIPPATMCVYQVDALRGDVVVATSPPLPVSVAPHSGEIPAVDLRAHVNSWGVFLSWPVSPSMAVHEYAISRISGESDGGTGKRIARVAARRNGVQRFRDQPPPGEWAYAVTPVVFGDREGEPARVEVEYPPDAPAEVAVDASLAEAPAGARVEGDVRFDESGTHFAGGWMQLEATPAARLGWGTRVSFEFKADSVEGMPVLLSCGYWQADGWFAQIYGGKLVIRTTAGDAVGPVVEPGVWYAVEWDYNGDTQTVVANGKSLAQPTRLYGPIPSKRPLRIGQYDSLEPQFSFRGTLRNVRILVDGGDE